jgi:hypothetical protein
VPVDLRPRRIRVVCWVAAVAVVALFTAVSFGLHGRTGAGANEFRPGDRAAMVGVGVLIGLGVLMFTRPRVRADARHVRVRNVVGEYDLPWSAVRAIRFDRHLMLELHDDEVVPVHAVQAMDKEYAVAGVRALRALHDASGDNPE